MNKHFEGDVIICYICSSKLKKLKKLEKELKQLEIEIHTFLTADINTQLQRSPTFICNRSSSESDVGPPDKVNRTTSMPSTSVASPECSVS